MRYLVFAAAFLLSPLTLANELDNPNNLPPAQAKKHVKPSADQIARAKDLPATVVIKIPISELKKKNPSFEVAHVKDLIPAGKKVTNLAFEKMAMNSEAHGIAFDSGNELDKTTSTASWGFGYWGRPWGGYGGYGLGYGYGGYGGYGLGYGYGGYGLGYGYAGYGGYGGCGGVCGPALYSSWAYPSFAYAGYSYPYTPYYGFYGGNSYYAYCNWNPGFY